MFEKPKKPKWEKPKKRTAQSSLNMFWNPSCILQLFFGGEQPHICKKKMAKRECDPRVKEEGINFSVKVRPSGGGGIIF